jgi:Fur family ferric uptake transcriptional regulator
VNSEQLRKLDFGDGYSVYEVSHGSPHHSHLYCRHCGKVEEFSDETIEERQETICEDRAFEPVEYSQKILGYCENCQDVVDS